MAQAKKRKIFDNRYEILSIVGRGSRSVVYHARHVKGKHREVALKVLIAKKGKVPTSDLLRKEALAMVSSRHKYVIRLDDFHSLGDLCYLAMEFAPLGDLRQYTSRENGKLLPSQAELFFIQAAEALEFIHKAGILHRDIKPDNLLIMDENNIRLGDFGVAILPGERSSLEELQKGIGTMNYMSPEVLDGKQYDARCDIYALGVSFYEMLAGIHPFEDAPLAEQINIRKDASITPLQELHPDIPDYLAATIMQAIAFDPDARFQNCRDLIQSLLVNRSTRKQAMSESQEKRKPIAMAPPREVPLREGKPLQAPPIEEAPIKKAPSDEPLEPQSQAPKDPASQNEEDSEAPAKKKRRRRRRKRRKTSDEIGSSEGSPLIDDDPFDVDESLDLDEEPSLLEKPAEQLEKPIAERTPQRSTQDVRHSMEEALRKIEAMSKPAPKQSTPTPVKEEKTTPPTPQDIPKKEPEPAPDSRLEQTQVIPHITKPQEPKAEQKPQGEPQQEQPKQERVTAEPSQQEAQQTPKPEIPRPEELFGKPRESEPSRYQSLHHEPSHQYGTPHGSSLHETSLHQAGGVHQKSSASLMGSPALRKVNPQMIVGAV
ncbi:MAG: protein kinase, partial [Bdellovibrionales bacterium]|nr:protein kinase [Bdellovibrionales bacterium]